MYFSGATSGNSICLGAITAFTNDIYEETAHQIGVACAPLSAAVTEIEAEGRAAVTAIPNPFSNITTLYFDNSDNQEISVLITDITGRVVEQITNHYGNTLEINRKDWASGVYFVQLRLGAEVYTSKL